jgi:hypothetical protein
MLTQLGIIDNHRITAIGSTIIKPYQLASGSAGTAFRGEAEASPKPKEEFSFTVMCVARANSEA